MKIKTDWNLSELFKSEEDVKKCVEQLKKDCKEQTKFKGKLNTRENILEFYKLCEKILDEETRIFCYLQLRKSLDGKDEFSRVVMADIEAFLTEIAPSLAFSEEELSKNNSEFLRSLEKDKAFKNYDTSIEDIIRGKKHILPEKIQAVLSMNSSFGEWGSVFDNFNDVDLKFGTVKTDKGTIKLTHARYEELISHPDQKVRLNVYNKCLKAYADFNYTLGTLYLSDAKESLFFSKIHKFKTLLSESCFADKTDEKVLTTLINATRSHLDLFYRFEKLKKKALGLKTYYYFDNYCDLGKNDQTFEFEKSCEIVLKALSVMGEDYTSVLKRAIEEGWLDAYEKPSKTSGGYCMTVYGYHPYVLLNHTTTYNGLSTIAHELGHAMHGYYTCKEQPITKSDPSIFACEVASIVNEILLNRYMVNNAKSKEEKLFYIHELLSSFYTTLFRQTMFSEFEYYVYSTLENSKPLIVEDLNKYYESLQAAYFGKEAKKTKYSKYEWSRVPHFYRPYYVYKYATGFISACTIAENILKDKNYVERYKNFLKAGSSVDPIELLKSVDVDLTKKSTLDGAFELYKSLLDEFEQIIN